MQPDGSVDNTANADHVTNLVQAGAVGTVNFGVASSPPPAALVLPLHGGPGADTDVFVGRDEEVARLSALLQPGSGTAVTRVAGMGGVGKTALALYCARAALGSGWFPGGAFSVNMQGYRADGGVPAESVLRPLLRLLGVDPLGTPTNPGEMAAVYQQLLDGMARSGREVLLVLDNVSTARQIAGLIPANPAHRVLVTTRDTVDIPGARGFSLDVLAADKAGVLLDVALRDVAPDDRRLADDPAGTRELVRTCGWLPLALRIVAALLAEEPDLSPAQLAAELAEAGIEGFVHGERALSAVLDLSWHHLVRRNRPAARLLRLLCLNPVPDCGTEAAAVLADASEARTVHLLRALRQAHLLVHTDRRWRMHDLVRAHTETYDADLTPDDLRAADTRLVNHYLIATQDAVNHLAAMWVGRPDDRFTGSGEALRWLDGEYPALLVLAHKMAEAGHHHQAAALYSQLSAYQVNRGYLTDQLTTSRLAYAAALRQDNLSTQADMANNLGLALGHVGLLGEAIDLYLTAIDLHTRNGDDHRAAKARNNLGSMLTSFGRHDEAIRLCREAVDAYRRAGDPRREAGAWHNLGTALAAGGRTDEAILACERAASINREVRAYDREVMAWTTVANILLDTGLGDDAIDVCHSAIAIGQAFHDTVAESRAWAGLGSIYLRLGRPADAEEAYRQSIATDAGEHPTGTVAQRWTGLGFARAAGGDLAGAAAAHREAVRTYHRIGDPHGEAMTSNNLGRVLLRAKDRRGAAEAHRTALKLTTAHDDHFGQAMTQANLGELHDEGGDTAAAEAAFHEAITLFHRIRDAKHEANAWLSLGMCLHDHDTTKAVSAYQQALTIFTESNDEHAAESAREYMRRASASEPLPHDRPRRHRRLRHCSTELSGVLPRHPLDQRHDGVVDRRSAGPGVGRFLCDQASVPSPPRCPTGRRSRHRAILGRRRGQGKTGDESRFEPADDGGEPLVVDVPVLALDTQHWRDALVASSQDPAADGVNDTPPTVRTAHQFGVVAVLHPIRRARHDATALRHDGDTTAWTRNRSTGSSRTTATTTTGSDV
ncbi:tetratricopeptide repeat protein [Actinosynnema sp. NPDC004786]